MSAINLTFINNSNDTNNSTVVIFQKNVGSAADFATAWITIRNVGPGEKYAFQFPQAFEIGATDPQGNGTAQATVNPGDAYSMVAASSGHVLQRHMPGAAQAENIDFRNELATGAIGAHIYRGGKLLASGKGIAPGQKAVFRFEPTIFIGVAPEIEEGQTIDSTALPSINTELSLAGLASADIVMTGGGSGSTATPFKFQLANETLA